MLRGMTIGVLLMLLSAHGGLSAQHTAPSPFKTLCVSEKATGFDWTPGNWVQKNFKPGEQLLIQKIVGQEPYCEADVTSGAFGTKGCYYIKALGSPASVFDFPENCDEISEKKSLKVVHCRKISFHPDGRFIQLPWHMDIFDHPKNDRKDSLVLSVGKCSRIVE